MTRKSKRRKTELQKSQVQQDVQVPIPNLPEKFLWMHVNSGTKIRNVMGYALKEFPAYKSLVWSGAGKGIGKVITCAELCKRKHPDLHQITKLNYVKSKEAESRTDGSATTSSYRVPEIHILLAKDPPDPAVPGYQSPGRQRLFPSRPVESSSKLCTDGNAENAPEQSCSILSNIATEEFAAMGLRTGQKRSRKGHQTTYTPSADKGSKKGKSS